MTKQTSESYPSWRNLRKRTQKLIGTVGLKEPDVTTPTMIGANSECIEIYDGQSISFGYLGVKTILGSARLAEVKSRVDPDVLRTQVAVCQVDSAEPTIQEKTIDKHSRPQDLLVYEQHLAAAEDAIKTDDEWNHVPYIHS